MTKLLELTMKEDTKSILGLWIWSEHIQATGLHIMKLRHLRKLFSLNLLFKLETCVHVLAALFSGVAVNS